MDKETRSCCENPNMRTDKKSAAKSNTDTANIKCTCSAESLLMKNTNVRCASKSTCKLNSMCNLVCLVFLILNQVLLSHCGSFPVISAYESVNGVVTKLNVPANSDLVLTADPEESGSGNGGDKNTPASGKNSRYLLLKCTATYPIQWIYSGDGIPEFTTNSTVNWTTEPMVFMAAATLLKFSAHYTGNYTCRSIQNFELSKHYYIYISGESFFTSTTGGPINFSRYDSTVRIPCGVSHPRVRVTLQKLVDGYVNCLQMNDSLSYDGKSGFRLQLSDFNQPEGDYLCIASFNGTFNFVQYKLILDPNRQQSLYLPQPTKETSLSRIKCATFQQNCGVNALCTLDVNDEPICKCNRHHHGNPYQKCHPECMIDTDCPSNRICYNHACEDPCPNACGPSTELVQKCQVVNHKAICNYNSCNPSPCGKFSKCEDFNTRADCSCLPGYIGSPPYCSEPIQVAGSGPNPNPSFEFVPVQESSNSNSNPNSNLNSHITKNHSSSISGISFPMGPMACRTRQDCPPYLTCRMNVCENPCYPNPCGKNGNCRVQNYEPICSCAPGFIKVNQYCLPNNCRADRECPESRSCVRNKCINPCNGYCGENAICAVKRHRPACACLPGHRGDPFQKCKPAAVQNTETHGLSMVLSNSAFANGMLMTPESPKYPALAQGPELDPVLDRSPNFAIPQSPNPNPNSNSNSNSNSKPTVIPIPVSIQKLQNKNQNQPQNLKLTVPSSTSGPFPLPTPGIVQPFKLCDPSPNSPKKSKCGANAKCLTTQSQHAYCQCSNGFTGDPYRFCYQIISLPNPSAPTTLIIKDLPGAGSALETEKEGESHFESSIESIVNANFAHLVTAAGIVNRGSTTPSSIPGHSFISNNYYNRKPTTESTNAVTPVIVCVNNDDCPDDKMCITGSCFDPCSLFHPVCGQNQDCRVENHRSVCVCKPGHPVRIYNKCYRPGNYSSLSVCDRSSSNPCGPHSICNQREDGITCRCSSGATGEPPNCRPKNASGKTGVKTVVNFKDDHSDSFSSISSSSSNSNSYSKKIPATCAENEDCPNELNCRNNTCKDPCDGYCGILARCRVYQHMPKCFCPNGFRGNPRIRCIAPLFNSRHTGSESLESKSSLEHEGLQFDFDFETTQRITDMETETEVNAKSEEKQQKKQLEMKTVGNPVQSKNTNAKSSQVRGVEKTKAVTATEEKNSINKSRTEKEKQDMARYEDEIFDDSNEFLF